MRVAQRSGQPLGPLTAADATLAQLKFNWRLAQDWQLISPGQFEHGIRLMEEVGRLLGAWLKTAREKKRGAGFARAKARRPFLLIRPHEVETVRPEPVEGLAVDAA